MSEKSLPLSIPSHSLRYEVIGLDEVRLHMPIEDDAPWIQVGGQQFADQSDVEAEGAQESASAFLALVHPKPVISAARAQIRNVRPGPWLALNKLAVSQRAVSSSR